MTTAIRLACSPRKTSSRSWVTWRRTLLSLPVWPEVICSSMAGCTTSRPARSALTIPRRASFAALATVRCRWRPRGRVTDGVTAGLVRAARCGIIAAFRPHGLQHTPSHAMPRGSLFSVTERHDNARTGWRDHGPQVRLVHAALCVLIAACRPHGLQHTPSHAMPRGSLFSVIERHDNDRTGWRDHGLQVRLVHHEPYG